MTARLHSMLIEYATRYGFRPRRFDESLDIYREALVEHVRIRDYSAAHELRVGRLQPEWTPEDVKDFHDRMMRGSGPRREFPPGHVQPFAMLRDDGPYDVTEAGLLTLADRALEAVIKIRRREELRGVLLSVLLTDGRLLSTQVQRGDRIALLKQLAQNAPTFGYIVIADVWIHEVHTDNSGASKVDAIIVHIGTRDLRRTKVRPYRVLGNGVLKFEDPYGIDWKTDPIEDGNDPYAEIFVSVPPSSTTQ